MADKTSQRELFPIFSISMGLDHCLRARVLLNWKLISFQTANIYKRLYLYFPDKLEILSGEYFHFRYWGLQFPIAGLEGPP